MTINKSYFLFDVGATKTRLSFSYDGIDFEKYFKIFDTPKKYTDFLNLICDFFETHKDLTDNKIVSCGGIAGPMDIHKTKLIDSNNIDWINKPIKKDLEKITRSKVVLENDTALNGLGEANFLNKKDKIISYITFSTGINGVRIVNNKIDVSFQGFEIGSQIIDFDKSYRKNLHKGDLEELVGGKSILETKKINPLEIADFKFWREVEKIVSIGIFNSILFWSPEVVILGGGIMNRLELKSIKKQLQNLLKDIFVTPKIIKSQLGDLSGIYGALIYVKSYID